MRYGKNGFINLLMVVLCITSGCSLQSSVELSPKNETPAYQIKSISPSMVVITQNSNIEVNSDNSITTGSSDRVPHIYTDVMKWGMFETKPIQSPKEFKDATINAVLEKGDSKDKLIIEAASSEDGETWTGYTMLAQDSNEIVLLHPIKFIKFRVTLLSFSIEQPLVIKNISVLLK